MQTKLTLRLDDALIAQAKEYAKERGKSLSQIVADYFQLLTEDRVDCGEASPITDSLLGILRNTDVDENDYHLV